MTCGINHTGLRIQHEHQIGSPFEQARHGLSLKIAKVRFRGLKSFHGNRSALLLCGAQRSDNTVRPLTSLLLSALIVSIR
jgi:hypothetical protein